MNVWFQKFFAIELGLLGVIFLLYAVAALLGWKYARPKRWWNWEPAKRRTRHYAPEAFMLAILLLNVSRWSFQDSWEPDLSLWAIWLAALIISIIFSSVGSKKFAALAKEQGMSRTPTTGERALSAASSVLIALSGFFHRIWWLQGAMIQCSIVLLVVTIAINYPAPADTAS